MINKELRMIGVAESFISKVYTWMFAGLLTTAATAYFTFSQPAFLDLIFTYQYSIFALFLAQISIIIYLQANIRELSYQAGARLFLLYSVLVGVMLAPIFIIYTMTSIVHVFTITAGMFGCMALYGYSTKKDLSGFGSMLFMGLIGLIIAQTFNMFFDSCQLDRYIALFGVVLFTCLTAYDMQKIKRIGDELQHAAYDDHGAVDLANKLALLAAVTLYLDFLNLFLKMLKLMGKKRK